MISVFGSLVDDEEIKRVAACMKSQWMGFGKQVDEFEKKYQKKYKLRNFAMVDSGSNALYMATKILDLPLNSEVILPSFTWVSCAQAILLAGCKPVFCDVDLMTMNVRAEDIQKKISKNTSAIMVVHYAGLAVEMKPILELGYPVIEDAAHAIDSTYEGQACGSIGDVGIFSFDAVKNLTVGEGGGITTKDNDKIERAKIMRYCGIGKSGFDTAVNNSDNKSRWWEYNIRESFIKMLPTNLSANIGLAQLEKIDKLQERRKKIWNTYQSEFSSIKEVVTPINSNKKNKHSYFTFCIRVPQRDNLANYLLKNKIYTTLRYHPLHMNAIYKQTNINLKNTNTLNKEALNIPIHPRMSDEDVRKVVKTIYDFFK